VRLHEPVLPVLGPERPLELVEAGRLPALDELRLHQGTVWRWNRAIYDPAEGGHLRVELRALPAGPTVVDMLANAAFALGLTLALAPEAGQRTRRLAFQQAHHNFYRAAQLGLGAELAWPLGPGGQVRTLPAGELVLRLLPVARQGLEDAGVASSCSSARGDVGVPRSWPPATAPARGGGPARRESSGPPPSRPGQTVGSPT